MATDQATVIKSLIELHTYSFNITTFWRNFCSFATKQSTKKFFITIKSFRNCSISSKSCTYVCNVGLILVSCNNGRTERTWSNSKQLQQTYMHNIFVQAVFNMLRSTVCIYLVFSKIPVMDYPSRDHVSLIVMTLRAMVCSCVVTELWLHLITTCTITMSRVHNWENI